MHKICQILSLLLMIEPSFAWPPSAEELLQAKWEAYGSKFVCRLIYHHDSIASQVVFEQEAGLPLHFSFQVPYHSLHPGLTEIITINPPWLDWYTQSLGYGYITDTTNTIALSNKLPSLMLDHLALGQTLVFLSHKRYTTNTPAYLFLSSIHFQDSYQKYQKCLISLAPIHRTQAQHLTLLFNTNQKHLSFNHRYHLDKLIQFVRLHPNVKQIHIKGYTDTVGNLIYNFKLSKLRAQMVYEYLKQHLPVPAKSDHAKDKKDLFLVEFYGEDNPIRVTDNKEQNNILSRRVTIDLSLGDDPLPSLL